MNHTLDSRARSACLLLVSLATGLFSVGCASGGDFDDFGDTSDAIIGGVPHDGDPQTVYLMQRGSFVCTGSLIAPRVVLTALHCVDSGGGVGPASSFSVGTGPRADGSAPYARVQEVRTPRGETFAGNDIAVLLLTTAGSLTPYEASFVAPRVGDPIIGIGYGQTRDGVRGGRKYRGADTIGRLGRMEIVTARALPCYGDSGGPLFDAAGRVIGVVSRGTAGTCEGGSGIYTRVDAHRALIERALADTGATPPPPATPPPAEPPPPSEPPPAEPPPAEPPPAVPPPAPGLPPGTVDVCAAPFERAIAVGEIVRLGCTLPPGRVVRLFTSAPQSIRTTLSIEDRTYVSTDAGVAYTFRARATPTPFTFTVVGSNRYRAMPIRVETVR